MAGPLGSTERRTMMRIIPVVSQEGDVMRLTAPTETQLIQHAERFGVEGVVETAHDCGHPLDVVIRLQQRCDVIEYNWHKANKKYYTKPKQSPDVRVKKLLGIKDEEEVVAA